jgi:cytochrome c oxidase subunit 2
MQSALSPASAAAHEIATLTYVMAAGGAVILLLVMALLVRGAAHDAQPAGTTQWVVGGGIVFPGVVLLALLLYTSPMTAAMTAPARPAALRVEIDGRQWWWHVRYVPAGGGEVVVAANELRIPAGLDVELILTSPDVIHSFWAPSLAGKVDMVPGHVNRLLVRADRPGVYRAQCAEYCGTQHAQMALVVVAETRDAFAAWLAAEAAPAQAPATPDAAQGHEAFLAHGCGGCHTIRGTAALGILGPDLTHVASRRTLAAGALDNGAAAMRAWLARGGTIKPGNRMPSYGHLDPATLDAMAAYLANLR